MSRNNILLFALLLGGCATGINPQKYNDSPVSPASFDLCHGYSCTYKTQTGFTTAEWKSILAIFNRHPTTTASAERSKIAQAIARMEHYTGVKTGTSEDAGEAETLKSSHLQMDCIDETVNTTHYLAMLQQAGLLKFYEAYLPTHRGYFIDGRWPHNTAVMRDIRSGDLYVVDSFYRRNGEEPYILPRQQWLDGWKPPGGRP